MTNPPLPTAGEAMSEAVICAKRGDVELGQLWLAIAHELNADAQRRAMRQQAAQNRFHFAGLLPTGADIKRSADRFTMSRKHEVAPLDAAGYAGESAVARMVEPDDATQIVERLKQASVTTWLDPSATQRMPVVWSIGDKADCRHCHTPIELCEAAIEPNALVPEAVAHVWRHKYTGQAVCAVPVMAKEAGCDMGDEECTCERPQHTFAAPEVTS